MKSGPSSAQARGSPFPAGLSGRMASEAIGMDPSHELGELLLIAGIVMVGVGAFLFFGPKLPLRLGRLPGDISYQGRHGSFYFPIVTCILVSAALTLIVWIVNYFRR
jgi:Protein of unknown function (DUF2905)